MMYVLIKCLRGQLKHIPALDPEGHTFTGIGSSMKEWENFSNSNFFFSFFFPALLFSWKEDRRMIQPVDLHRPRISFQLSGVDPLVVQIIPAANKAVQPWHLIPSRICLCSYVLFPSTPLIFDVVCACLVDTSLSSCDSFMVVVRLMEGL